MIDPVVFLYLAYASFIAMLICVYVIFYMIVVGVGEWLINRYIPDKGENHERSQGLD